MNKIFAVLTTSLIILVSCNTSPANMETYSVSQQKEIFGGAAPEASSTEFAHYPEDFLTMSSCYGSGNLDNVDPITINTWGINADGDFRIAYYEDFRTYERAAYTGYGTSEIGSWIKTQIVYINNNYITSEGISIGLKKLDVINAYDKYGIREYNLSQITQFGLDSLDIVLKGITLADTFLYVDNGNIFNDAYTGIDYWGGIGAYIFILDSNDSVIKIVRFDPVSH